MRGQEEIAVLAQAFNQSSERIAGLVQQQRRMLQSASHELRSPLARLRMALELLADPEQPAELRERLSVDAAGDVEELDQLIGDLLLAARLTDSELPRDFSAVDLGPILREEAARVNAEVQTTALMIQGNRRMLRSLVRNLLENARRYGKDPVRLTLARTGDELSLCIDDAGPGIVESERERIFEPFYRPPKHRETQDGGVGLGLALVKSIAEHHGGSVRYVPLAQGSRFEVRLPAG
jgi:signal transduction histidine kinase